MNGLSSALRDLSHAAPAFKESSSAILRLSAYADRHAAVLVQVVRSKILISKCETDDVVVRRLLNISGWDALESTDRFLAEAPHAWAKFTEPQITGGWKYFLSDQFKLERCQAAFDAAWTDRSKPVPLLKRVLSVDAEAEKIDLLIKGKTEDGRSVAVCMEAKFGHTISADQLENYEGKLFDIDSHSIGDKDDGCLIIVAPRWRADIRNQYRMLNNQWRFLSWQEFLIRFENALNNKCDDCDFKRFRRTVLQRSKLENVH